MKVRLAIAESTDLAINIAQTEIYIKVTFSKAKDKGLERIRIVVLENHMKVNGKITRKMDLENIYMLMEISIKDYGVKIKRMEKENLPIQQDKSMMGTSKMICLKVMEQ
jgi:hypothetical protein